VVLFFFFLCTLVTAPRGSLSLKLSDTRVYEPQIRAGWYEWWSPEKWCGGVLENSCLSSLNFCSRTSGVSCQAGLEFRGWGFELAPWRTLVAALSTFAHAPQAFPARVYRLGFSVRAVFNPVASREGPVSWITLVAALSTVAQAPPAFPARVDALRFMRVDESESESE